METGEVKGFPESAREARRIREKNRGVLERAGLLQNIGQAGPPCKVLRLWPIKTRRILTYLKKRFTKPK